MPNRKDCYADIEKFRKTRYEQRKRYYHKTQKYKRRPWTKEEDKLVLEHSITDTKLSSLICRSVSTIQVRRSKLKKQEIAED